jgi:hypothetical protein
MKGDIAGSDDTYNVQRNSRGQPIGKGSEYLASYIGTKARQNFALDIADFRRVPKEDKEAAWKQIQAKFTLPDEYRRSIITDLGHKHRSHRYDMYRLFLRDLPDDEQAWLDAFPGGEGGKYPYITRESWNNFVRRRRSQDFAVCNFIKLHL